MAEKKAGTNQAKTTVRRIKATDTETKKPSVKKSTKVAAAKKQPVKKRVVKSTDSIDTPVSRNPLKALGGYFKGAWHELKQVRWPTRSATWSLTLAVLIFSGFFVLLVILLDMGFKWSFEQILG